MLISNGMVAKPDQSYWQPSSVFAGYITCGNPRHFEYGVQKDPCSKMVRVWRVGKCSGSDEAASVRHRPGDKVFVHRNIWRLPARYIESAEA